MSKADYTHKLKSVSGRNILVIEDLNLGNKSVTNSIEEVIRDIEVMEHISARDYMIVYRDSEGNWNGWDVIKEEFIHLQEDSWYNAVQKYIQHQIK